VSSAACGLFLALARESVPGIGLVLTVPLAHGIQVRGRQPYCLEFV